MPLDLLTRGRVSCSGVRLNPGEQIYSYLKIPSLSKLTKLLVFILFILLLALSGCRPPVIIPPHRLPTNRALWEVLRTPMEEPTIRIGLELPAKTVRVSSEGGVYLINKRTRKFFKVRAFYQEVAAARVGYIQREGKSLFAVQVASFQNEENARRLKKSLEVKHLEPVKIEVDPVKGWYRVKVGSFSSRKEAEQIFPRLTSLGYDDFWVVEKKIAYQGKLNIRITTPQYGKLVTTSDPILCFPRRDESPLMVNDIPFRGAVELFIDDYGKLQVVNELSLEDYLKGVVPCELSPQLFPEIEALKAQAIAARTYAYKNMGRFSASGYDLCPTAACQVYKGYSVENHLSNRAVEDTRGIIITYQEETINALYTSTCGGHTEDGENIFTDEFLPYLRGVECYPEMVSQNAPQQAVEEEELIYTEDGELANDELAQLVFAGILPRVNFNKEFLEDDSTYDDIESWIEAACRLLKIEPPEGLRDYRQEDDKIRVAELINWLIKAFQWEKRAGFLVSDKDIVYLTRFPDLASAAPLTRRNLALLMREGVILPFNNDTLRLTRIPSRAFVLKVISRMLARIQPFHLARGSLHRLQQGGIIIRYEGSLVPYRLSENCFYFKSFANKVLPTRGIDFTPGDEVVFHHSGGTIDYLKVITDPRGISHDRYSRYYSWEIRYSQQELSRRVNSFFTLGDVVDLHPLKLGISGRVVKLKILGKQGEVVLSGLKIRSVLGLRENLFIIERRASPEGFIEVFTFIGKGWGHGVGLCQVGAFGMARKGATYQEILQHYYSGVDLTRAY